VGNREALLEGAIRCLETRGYAQTTARDLVRESKTNLGAIGYHFGSKEALLYEALTVCFRRWLERLASEAISLAGTSPADLGSAILAKAYEAIRSDRSVVVAFFEALCQAERSEELRNQLAGFYGELRVGIAEVVAVLAGVSAGDPAAESLASLVLALVDGLSIQYLLDPASQLSSSALLDAATLVARAQRGTPGLTGGHSS
jgi:AcrR family transcriptional regulator